MIPFTLHHTLLWYVQFSGSVETPSIVGRYTIIDKCTNYLYDWEMTQWLSNKLKNLKIVVAWYICGRNQYICPNVTLWQSKKGNLYLGSMKVWYTLFATCDAWPGGELSNTCALYEIEKMSKTPPKSIGSHSSSQHTSSWPHCVHVPLEAWPLQASPLSFVVN
jgi:hypothetical protein